MRKCFHHGHADVEATLCRCDRYTDVSVRLYLHFDGILVSYVFDIGNHQWCVLRDFVYRQRDWLSGVGAPVSWCWLSKLGTLLLCCALASA